MADFWRWRVHLPADEQRVPQHDVERRGRIKSISKRSGNNIFPGNWTPSGMSLSPVAQILALTYNGRPEVQPAER
jgi:hypothetical protein